MRMTYTWGRCSGMLNTKERIRSIRESIKHAKHRIRGHKTGLTHWENDLS